MIFAAWLFTTVALFLILFHALLMFGVPWGHLTQGGFSKGKLPKNKRVIALIQIVILVIMGVVVLAKSNIAFSTLHELSSTLIWVVVAISFLSFVLNLISPSKPERLMGVPITLMMLSSSLVVAVQ